MENTSTGGENYAEPNPQRSNRATRRLTIEFNQLQNHIMKETKPNYIVELLDDNLLEWNVYLYGIDSESELGKDMAELNIQHILLNLKFSENYPFVPPFVRVVEPIIDKGYMLPGGAICMEILSSKGWSSAFTVESLLVQFSASLVEGETRVVRNPGADQSFNQADAEKYFDMVMKYHDENGWTGPEQRE